MKGIIKTLLNERLFNRHSEPQVMILNEFIKFACEYLGVPLTKVNLKFSHDGLVTTANYGNKIVNVFASDRALVDIMRSIAHELVHYKQDIEGRLNSMNHEADNKAGSPIENEANAKAGEIIRKFGERYKSIYQ